MDRRLTARDWLLLLTTLPIFLVAFVLHVQETARTGLAQLPVLAEWQPGDYPRVGGYRLETDSSGSGLETGDRLIRVGDRDLRGQGYIGFQAIGLARTTPGHPVPLVVERDGERLEVALESRPHPQRWSRIPILLLIPIFSVLLLLRAPGQPHVQRFYLCFMTYAIGQSHFYGGPEWQTWLAAAVWNLAAPLMLFFMLRWARLFPDEMPDERRAPVWLPWLAMGAYVVFVRLNYVLAWPLPIGWVPRVSFASHAAMSLVGVMVLSWNYLHAWPPGRRRLRWILLGTGLGSLPVVLAGVAPLVFPGWQGLFRQAFAAGFLSSAIWMAGAAMAVVRDNAFDVDRLIGVTAAWTTAAAAAIAALVLAVPALAEALSPSLGIDPGAVRLGLAAALGALAIPAGLALRPRMDRLLFPQRVAVQESTEVLLDDLARCPDRPSLLGLGMRRTREIFDARGVALYERSGDDLRLHGVEDLSVPERLADGADLRVPVHGRGVPAALGSDAAMVVPLRPGSRTDALLVLGAKTSGDIYTTSDVAALIAITARMEAEWLLFEKQAADRESLAKTSLLATAGHDLRQPLHAVSLLAEALGGKLDDPEMRQLAERIGASTHDLDEMLTGLLDRSKLDAGIVRPTLGTVNLGELFEQLESELAPLADAAGVRLRVVPTRLAVRSDRLLLARMLRNLLGNALRYAPGSAVLLAARPRGEQVRIEVRDSGPGIAAGAQRQIFEAFHQLPGSARAGLGLGLSIVEGLARVLDHSVGVHSEPGRGSTFHVSARRTDAAVAVAAVSAADPGASLAGLRVLVVENDVPAREACTLLLRSWGCDVRDAAGGLEASEAVRDWRPAFVLTDHQLDDGETGASVLADLGAVLGAVPPAAIMTAESDPESLERLRSDAWPVLRKPVRPAQLRAVISAR